MLTSIMQFGLQMVGFLVASQSDRFGPELIIGTQMLALLIGVIGFARIRAGGRPSAVAAPRLFRSVIEGAKTVFGSPSMRMVMIQNVAMALFFMGSYIVTMPILVREVFSGSAQDLAFMNGANSLGLVSTILLLLRLGDVQRQGRALLLAQGLGALVLAGAGVAPSYLLWVVALFVWGICGGAAMTMSRTIMQEQAPEAQRGRVMSFYSFSFMGAGPVGALICGYLVELFGPQSALMIAAGSMLLVLVVGASSGLWRLEGHTHQVLNEATDDV
jgi:MFS family permease